MSGYIDFSIFSVPVRYLSAVLDDPYTYDTGVWDERDVTGGAEAVIGALMPHRSYCR